MLTKPSRSKDADAKPDRDITEHEGDVIIEILRETIDCALTAIRQSMAVSEALIAKGVLNKAEVDARMRETLPETQRLVALLAEIQKSITQKPS